jgi:membrane-bound lytic murein transglycosylase B
MKRTFSHAQLIHSFRISLLAILLVPATVWPLDMQRDDVKAFVNELAANDQFDPAFVERVLASSEMQQSILDAISRPAEGVMPWHKYRAIFIQPERIEAGVVFYEQHKELLEAIEAETGVSPAMILGIVGVESFFGTRTGTYRVVDALATLGFDYPPRSTFFRKELAELFRLAQEEDLELLEIKGSYAGAMGPPQFIPSSYRHYSVDGDGDGKRDLLNSWPDILASVANYFAVHKWAAGEPVAVRATIGEEAGDVTPNDGLKPNSTVGELSKAGIFFPTEFTDSTVADVWQLDGEDGIEYWVGFNNLHVITRYNRSIMYAMATWELGEAIIREAGK